MKRIDQIFQTLVQKFEKEGVPGQFSNLREKGVECAIMMPLLDHLGYDTLVDVQYEVASPKRTDHRFDFVFGDKKHVGSPKEVYNIVMETKSLDTKVEPGSGGSKQIQEYILNHDDIYCGILTNGIDYVFFLQKKFIQDILQKKEFVDPGYGSVIPIFSIGRQEMIEGMTVNILSIFKKDIYIESITKLASLAYKTITGDGYRKEILLGDKESNERIKQRMEECLVGQRGELYDCIVENKVKEGALIKYDNQNFSLTFKVGKFGKIYLDGKEAVVIKQYSGLIKEEYGKCIRDIADSMLNAKGLILSYVGPEDFLQKIFNSERKISESKPLAKELRGCFSKALGVESTKKG